MLGQVILHNDGAWVDAAIGAEVRFAFDSDTLF
jgi:hypothetical protein